MYKTLGSKEIFQHKRITLIEDDIEYENGQKSKFLKFKHTSNASQTIGIRHDSKICMIREYSHAVNEHLIQFPGGLIDLDEDKEQGAIREFCEETGYEISKLHYLGMIYPYHRRLPEKLFLFVGRVGKEIEEKIKDESEEDIEVLWKSENEIIEMINKNLITNSHTLSHWTMYINNRK